MSWLVGALQDPRKKTIPFRDLFPTRIALALVEADQTGPVLGKGARQRGADCSRIPLTSPGTAWVWCDGETEPTRVRASNWLRFGLQPKSAGPGMVPGHCKHKAHDRASLGLGGRRVLVSRKWSGKTLTARRADRAAVVRAALEEAGIDPTTTTSSPSPAQTGAGHGRCCPARGLMTGPTRLRSRRPAPPASGGATSTRRPRQLGRGRRHRRPRREFGSSARKEFEVEQPRKLLRIEEAAEVMGMSAVMCAGWLPSGGSRSTSWGAVRIARADIAAYIEAGRVEPITASDVSRDLRRVG